MKTYCKVLSIAGSDSGGGAGIQADIKTISACGCFATTAITAVTSQNTLGITDVHPIPVVNIASQIKAVLEDIGTDSVKIGMLYDAEVIKAVQQTLHMFSIYNIVLDPVIVSTSGKNLLEKQAIDVLKKELIPFVRVLTPNIPEAELLLNKKVKEKQDLYNYARLLSEEYSVSVLLKSGHLEDDELMDVFYNFETKETIELFSKRVETRNTHGTGCTLSSALASYLAQNNDLNTAVTKAKHFINDAIIYGKDYDIGNGYGAVNHFLI